MKQVGSEGWCAHCEHYDYCKGSTKGTQASRQGECEGYTEWYTMTGKRGKIKHHTFSEVRE